LTLAGQVIEFSDVDSSISLQAIASSGSQVFKICFSLDNSKYYNTLLHSLKEFLQQQISFQNGKLWNEPLNKYLSQNGDQLVSDFGNSRGSSNWSLGINLFF